MPDDTSKPASKSTTKACSCRIGIFAYDLIVVLVLLIVGIVYVLGKDKYSLGAENLNISVRAMWFGALGGIVISLKGVYDHCCQHGDWDDCFDLWHLGRPVSGALAGLITLVLLLAVNSTSPNEPVVYAIAFIFGTQERRFFNFLYKVAALVVTVPDDQKTGLKGTAIEPAEGKAGTLVLITGQGFAPDATATIGTKPLDNAIVAKDGTAIVGNAPANVPAGAAGAVDVTITNPSGERVVLPGKFTYTA